MDKKTNIAVDSLFLEFLKVSSGSYGSLVVQTWILYPICHHLYMSDGILPVSDRGDTLFSLAIFQLKYLIALAMIKGFLEVTFVVVEHVQS